MQNSVTRPSLKRDSNALRASVFDVFLELGALEQNSKLAQWILAEEPLEEDEEEDSSSSSQPEAFAGGSKYRERFDSFILPNLDEGQKAESSQASKFFRSKSRARKGVGMDDSAVSLAKKPSLFRFKSPSRSATTIPEKQKEELSALAYLPGLPRAQSVAGNYPRPYPFPEGGKPALFRYASTPSGSDGRSVCTEEWEDLSTTMEPGEVRLDHNPFLGSGPTSSHRIRPLQSNVDDAAMRASSWSPTRGSDEHDYPASPAAVRFSSP